MPTKQTPYGPIIENTGFEVNQRKLKPTVPKTTRSSPTCWSPTKSPSPRITCPQLDEDIRQLQNVLLIQNEQGPASTRWVEQFKKNIIGRPRFAGFVLKRSDERYIDLIAYYTPSTHRRRTLSGKLRGFPFITFDSLLSSLSLRQCLPFWVEASLLRLSKV